MPSEALSKVLNELRIAAQHAGVPEPRLLAVGKTRPASDLAALAADGQTAFGENYVQEALAKQAALTSLPLEWHLIGHLQSNKAREAARHFAWVQTVDRLKLVEALAKHRPPEMPPLNLLIQVNIDDETTKHGCQPSEIPEIAERIGHFQNLKLRGLMAIPAPAPDTETRARAFDAMRALFLDLQNAYAGVDTLSMGMSDDAELAIAHGSTMVRVGRALFGERASQ
ncbi:YggS family pyridoxal phosphate-dependent enzyme [Lysobacter soyae]|uniref:Pyridoxal phosphate homeostasis protein n=1 Tax=Lysobacter soyae TaxID=2764185 RepID=A0ABX8WRK3_9GAMM|nr:YggS family pyridoxal phosphate-dependent enzyme [Lysobacter sp. CJ11]QYR53461.1 YggS family pyridoxal phosphate-dependent enzyme [Lysobacter sp. CJ11]